MSTFDLNILPIHRANGQNQPDLPGLLAFTPPRKPARGRERDSLILYLMLAGNAEMSGNEITRLNSNAANAFYQSAGTLTTAMRKATEHVNAALLERNLSTTGRGQYALGMLVLAVVREAQCTLLLSGPTHVVWVGAGASRYIHDPALAGKGLGSSQSVQSYFAQVELHSDDLLVVCGKFPRDWQADLLGERPPTSLEATYRKLTFTKGDLHAALIQPQIGQGILTILHADVTSENSEALTVDGEQLAVSAQAFDPTQDTFDSASEDVAVPPTDPAERFSQSLLSRLPSSGSNQLSVSSDQLSVDSEQLSVGSHQPQVSSLESPSSQFSNPPNPPDSVPQLPITNYPPPSITEDQLDRLAEIGTHMLQPSTFEVPTEFEPVSPNPPATQEPDSTPRSFPPSIPRLQAVGAQPIVLQPSTPLIEEVDDEEDEDIEVESVPVMTAAQTKESKPDAHVMATRQMAKMMVGGIRTGRRMSESIRLFFMGFIPRLLPGGEVASPAEGAEGEDEGKPVQQQMFVIPTYAMVLMSLAVAVVVGTVAVAIYLRFGQSVQYDELYSQALTARDQAVSESDPTRQRIAWETVLNLVDRAEEYRQTDESNLLRTDAQANYDSLMGITRLNFAPAFTNGLSGVNQISRLAASESDLYMLDAERGNILHAAFTGQSLQVDNAFNCQPGTYAGYEVGALVDLVALPKVNAAGATVLGVDATGTLLYCAPGQVPQAIPLPSLPNTNWGRITSFVFDAGNLYILDATSRSVWVFPGKDSTFVDTPYFYFGNQIPNSIDTAIDLGVTGDDLYLLHADGHISTCTFSRIAQTPTKCVDPLNFQDAFPAHKDINVFAQANFTQLVLTTPPNSVLLLLDSAHQTVFRFTPRSLELQNQLTGYSGEANPFETGSVGAITVSPNYVLYIAIGNQVYFATNLP